MAVCLDYQSVYCNRRDTRVSVRRQIYAVVTLLVVLAVKVWVQVETTELGYALATERQRTVEYDMERRDLELQLSVLYRPDTLAALAQERLGLTFLDPKQARKIALPTKEL